MPTDVAIGIRRKAAIKRIEDALNNGGDYPLELPTRSQYGQKMLVLQQIEVIADYVENAPALQQTPLELAIEIPEKYLRAEKLAREGANKADIVAALLEEVEGIIEDDDELEEMEEGA